MNEDFYLTQEEPVKGCLLAMRTFLLNFDDDLTETKKYGMPCFCYKGKMCCYLWVDKKTKNPYFLWVEGQYLQHPALEKGKRARMKILRVAPNQDLPITTLNIVLEKALELYKNGTISVKNGH